MSDSNLIQGFFYQSFLSDLVVQISFLFVLILCINFSYVLSLFSGLLIVGSYLGGIIVFNILWGKQYFKKFFSPTRSISVAAKPIALTGCNVCGDSSCKRQKSIRDNQPWLGLNIPKEIDQAIQDLLNKILNEFVTTWYSSYTKDDSFILELKRCMRYAASVLLRRMLQVDIGEVITDHLITTGMKHANDCLHIMQVAQTEGVSIEVAAVKHLNDRLHPAVASRKSELQYLRVLCSQLSVHLLQPSQLKCLSFSTLIRELLAGWVLLPLTDTLCDPYCINNLILLALSHEPLTQYPETQIVQVQFLQRFVTPNKNLSLKKSPLQFELSVILKDQKLLYTFMQFLKKEGTVNILQFCLDVEEFSKKIISDLTTQDKNNLHKEAWDLYSVYFKSDSPDSIHLPKHIIEQMEQVLEGGAENIVRLRTSTPLFKAYEIAFSMLEEIYCPMFHQSDDFFPLLFESHEVTKNTKSNCSFVKYLRNVLRLCKISPVQQLKKKDNFLKLIVFLIVDLISPVLPGSPVRSRNSKRSGEMSTVAKLSNKFQKFLQFQAVDGKVFFQDSPFDIADTECTEELNLGMPCDVMFRDMSTWRVSIPSVTTKQDANTKPYPVFTINVIDIVSKDQMEEPVRLKWNVERRFNDFYALQAKLTEFHGDLGEGIQLPSKTGIFAPRGNEFLESRKQEKCGETDECVINIPLTGETEAPIQLFEEYLQKLLQQPNLRGSDLLYSFLNSSAEFSSCLTAPDGIGKMLRKSVEPIKLRKERGQHLENFLNTFLSTTDSSKKGNKYEWQDVNLERPRNKRSITKSIFRNNFQEALNSVGQSVDIHVTNLNLSGAWDCLFYTASVLMGGSFRVLQLIATVKSLFGHSPDLIFKNYVNQKLRSVLVAPRISHLVRLLQGALFNSTYQPGRKSESESLRDKVLMELHRLTQNVFIKFFLPRCNEGLTILVDGLQHPILNKHLYYCLFDEVVRILFPEIATSG